MSEPQSPEDDVAIIFGGSRGIGAAIAERLAADGLSVALTYQSRPDKAAGIVAAITAAGGHAMAIAADSADPMAIREAVAEVVRHFHRPLSVAVVNAGVLRRAEIDAFSIADLDLVLDVNVRGTFLAIQAAVAHMRDGGRVVTIGSNAAIRPFSRGSSVYAMTKAAVASMVMGVALDLAPRRITVNNIQPGPIQTDMTAGMAEALRTAIPLQRMGQPEDVAALVSYVVSNQAGYMTGASLTIDGGFAL